MKARDPFEFKSDNILKEAVKDLLRNPAFLSEIEETMASTVSKLTYKEFCIYSGGLKEAKEDFSAKGYLFHLFARYSDLRQHLSPQDPTTVIPGGLTLDDQLKIFLKEFSFAINKQRTIDEVKSAGLSAAVVSKPRSPTLFPATPSASTPTPRREESKETYETALSNLKEELDALLKYIREDGPATTKTATQRVMVMGKLDNLKKKFNDGPLVDDLLISWKKAAPEFKGLDLAELKNLSHLIDTAREIYRSSMAGPR
jgi:hypothetical protein